MRQAIGLTTNCPELPFGAVIIDRDSGQVVAEGWNRSDENPLLHGEIDALMKMAETASTRDRSRLSLYTTAEPCPMCQGAILWAGIGQVVFGTSMQFLLETGWKQIDIPADEVARRAPGWKCEIVGGVLDGECNELFLTAARAAPGR